MRRALAPTSSVAPTSQPVTIPAPTGGLNTRDDRATLPITDAELMENWFPDATDVRVRSGSETYASGLPGAVETILSYVNGDNLKLFVTCAGQFQNISTVATAGTVENGTVLGMTGFTNDRWQDRKMATPGGSFLICVNGADARQIYNGTIWFAGSTNSASTIDVFTNIETYQRRLFYAEKGTLRFIYHTQVEAINGTVAAFDLGSLMNLGGELFAIGTWTRDGGSGMDDLIAFISNYGQVAIYSGLDPGDANSWALQGVYKIAPPVSYRCTEKVGGELLVYTTNGIVPLSAVMAGLVQQTIYTDKIRNSISDAWAIYQNNWGWEVKHAAIKNWLILNVPTGEGEFQEQYVMNVQTNAWTKFTGWNANCFEMHDDRLYFGTEGKVIQAGFRQSDDNNVISVDVKQGASTFGAPGRQKLFRMFRPMINTDGTLSMAFAMNTDFQDVIPTNVPTAVPIAVAEWDVATWDDYYWGDDTVPAGVWQSCPGFGTYGSIRITGDTLNQAVRWYATDVVFEVGGMI